MPRPGTKLEAVTASAPARPAKGEVLRYLDAYLDAVPGDASWQAALRGLETLLDRWHASDVDPEAELPVLLEATTELAERRGFPVGELLSAVVEAARDSRDRTESATGTHDRILAAAYRIFADKGFYSATVDEIATAAGVGKGTVYRHFEAKENLFRQVVEDRLDDLMRRIASAFRVDSDILGNIRRAVHVYLVFYEEHKEFYRILTFEQQGFGAEFKAAYIDGILRNVPAIRDQVVEATEAGKLKPLDDFYTIFYGLVGFVDGVIQKWFRNDCRGSLEDELDTIVEVLFYGFAKPAGLA